MKIFFHRHTQARRKFYAWLLSSMLLTFLPIRVSADTYSTWAEYGENAVVGENGTDVSIDGTTYTVKTAQGLAWIAWVTNEQKTSSDNDNFPASAGFKDCTVKLANDANISLEKPGDITDGSWKPIGNYNYINITRQSSSFQGTFDGNGKTISNMTINTSVNGVNGVIGLFGYVEGGTIKNLTINGNITIDGSITDQPDIGGIVGRLKGTIISCHNSCAISYSANQGINMGGVVGRLILGDNSKIIACSNEGAITCETSTPKSHTIGGIIGISDPNTTISNCFNTGEIKNILNGNSDQYKAIMAGGIIGTSSSTISNCYSTGNVTCQATSSSGNESICSMAGGIAGTINNGSIQSCYSTGAVFAQSYKESSYAGGIAGRTSNTAINNCLALNKPATTSEAAIKASASKTIYIARICGYNDGSTLTNNYASTFATLQSNDGSLAAPTSDTGADKINGADLYLENASQVTADWTGREDTKAFTAIGTDAGGQLPQLKEIDTFNDDGVTPATYGNAIAGQPAASLKTSDYLPALFGNWANYGQTANVGNSGTDVSVDGTTYTVKTAKGLAWIAWVTNEGKTSSNDGTNFPATKGFKNCTIKLANEANISLAKPTDTGNDFVNSWIPIGNITNFFQGTFDGNKKTITGMTITKAYKYVGLFGYMIDGTIKDLTVEGSISIKGASETIYIGGIAGCITKSSSKVISCHNSCTIRYTANQDASIGGITGYLSSGSIIACSNEGTIDAKADNSRNHVGGIAGETGSNTTISNCFNSGAITNTANISQASVTPSFYSGGIAGLNGAAISNCYSTGAVKNGFSTSQNVGRSFAGGIAGKNEATIEHCYATGSVVAEGPRLGYSSVGGIVGSNNESGASIKNCLALNKGTAAEEAAIKGINPNKENINIGRICGYNSATLTNNYASTLITLQSNNDAIAAPTTDIGADQKNGADTDLNKVAEAIADWTGDDNSKAFTAIGTDADGLLPQLKVITFDTDGVTPSTYGDAIAYQPAASLKTAAYLESGPLVLPGGDDENNDKTITITYADGVWKYKIDGATTTIPFNGTVKNGTTGTSACSLDINLTDSPAPELILDNVTISSSNESLNISGNATIFIKGTCKLTRTGRSSVILPTNNPKLTCKGDGSLDITGPVAFGNTCTVTIEESLMKNFRVHTTANLVNPSADVAFTNAWLLWESVSEEAEAQVSIVSTDGEYELSDVTKYSCNIFAIPVPAGKTYRYSKISADSEPKTIPQQGKVKDDASSSFTMDFKAPEVSGVATFTDVKDAIPVTVTQPDAGGSITVSCNDNVLVDPVTFVLDGATLTFKNYPLPGYKLEKYTVTPKGTTTDPVNPTDTYELPAGATAVTVKASFNKKATLPDGITEKEVIKTDDLPANQSVKMPTAIINPENTTATNSSAVKLVTGELEDAHKENVKETLESVASNMGNIIFAEIALVEVTSTPGDGNTTMKPIQPKNGEKVHVIYPYPAGTDKNDSFVIVHLKTDGTTTVYREEPDASKDEKQLTKSDRGLEFYVDSFSPFGIAYTKASGPDPGTDPDPDNDPDPVYYTVTLPAVEGLTTDPAPGEYPVEAWDSFRFYLTLDADYDQSVPVVTTDRGETIEPRSSDNAYIVKYVRTPVTISIASIRKNTDVANAAIEAGIEVWGMRSALCIRSDREEEVSIYTITGATVARFRCSPGDNRRPLEPGLYLVRIGRMVCKVIVR